MGDGYNDIAMLEFAGFGVAMGNAPEEIKQLADYVTDTNMNDGVALVVESFILRNLSRA
ncbi:putative phosphatase [compost metagenome]